jgi:hypothetical protein
MATEKRRQWDKRFDEAEANGGTFSPGATYAAATWLDCMCGAQDEAIPRTYHGREPIDPELWRLGAAFYEAVKASTSPAGVKIARAIGAKIDQRAAEILAELDAEAPQ